MEIDLHYGRFRIIHFLWLEESFGKLSTKELVPHSRNLFEKVIPPGDGLQKSDTFE